MLHQYLKILSAQLKNSKKVLCHSQLKAEKWTKSCFDLLSRIIAQNLAISMTEEQAISIGTTISSKTLEKIINGNYNLKYPIDPRTLNTLTKISIFLGFENWDVFVKTEEEKALSSSKTDEHQKVIISVQKALNATFLTYLNNLDFNEELLNNYFIKGQSAYKKIEEITAKSRVENTIISNPYNPSSFEILDIAVKKISDTYAQVSTKEYWLLCWWNTETERYIQRFKSIDKHVYILNKIEGNWKIKTDATTSDVIKIKKQKTKKKAVTKLAKAV